MELAAHPPGEPRDQPQKTTTPPCTTRAGVSVRDSAYETVSPRRCLRDVSHAAPLTRVARTQMSDESAKRKYTDTLSDETTSPAAPDERQEEVGAIVQQYAKKPREQSALNTTDGGDNGPSTHLLSKTIAKHSPAQLLSDGFQALGGANGAPPPNLPAAAQLEQLRRAAPTGCSDSPQLEPVLVRYGGRSRWQTPKAAVKLLKIFYRIETYSAHPTLSLCRAQLKATKDALQQLGASLNTCSRALLEHHHRQYPLEKEGTYHALVDSTLNEAAVLCGLNTVRVTIHAAAGGNLAELLRTGAAEQSQLPALEISQSDLVPDQAPDVCGIDEDGNPCDANGHEAATGLQDVALARNCWYNPLATFLTLRAMLRQLKPGGLLVISILRQQACSRPTSDTAHHHTAAPPHHHTATLSSL